MPRNTADHIAQRERFVEDLLAIMTVEEKVGQIVLQPAPDINQPADTLHIRDQLHRGELGGLIGSLPQGELDNLQRIAVEETRLGIPLMLACEPGRGESVVMPGPFALAASWAPDIVERASRIVADEARERGTNWLLGPDVSLARSVADKYLASSWGASGLLARCLASASVRGLQFSSDDDTGMLACLRVDDPSWTGRRDAKRLAEKLRLVAGVLRESPPGSVALDPATQDALDIGGASADPKFSIGGPGGFEGIDLAEWAEIARLVGQDLQHVPYPNISVDAVSAAVSDNRIALLQLDDAVRRVLAAKYDLGLFDPDMPLGYGSGSRTPQGERTVALDAARHSIVLLRNQPALLPLTLDSGDILVIGLAAGDRSLALGDAAGEGVSLLDGLNALGLSHKHVPGLAMRQNKRDLQDGALVNADRMAIGMASEAARRSRTIVVTLGEMETLGEAQRILLETLASVNRNIILVTLGSRPLDPEIAGDKLPCVIHAGQLGTMSGHAIAEVLSGRFSPCGRLPITLVDKGAPGLSLGHGLGYSEFGLGETSIELGHDRLVVSAVLHNVGEREGTETVQLYLRRPEGREKSQRELADFQRVTLVAGESRRLLFQITGNQLGQFQRDGRFVIEPGRYDIGIGLSEKRSYNSEIALPHAFTEALAKERASEPLPALFGKLRSIG